MAKQESRNLLVDVKPEIALQQGATLAQKLGSLRTRQDAEDGRRKEWNGVQKKKLSEIQDLAGELRSGQVLAPVECEGFVTADGLFTVRRIDTGEIIEERTATDADRQDDLGIG